MATGAELIGTAVYHALGYNVVDNYLIELDPARLSVAPAATIKEVGGTRLFTRDDVDAILRRAARLPNGRHRAVASRFADGRDRGPFRYYGTLSPRGAPGRADAPGRLCQRAGPLDGVHGSCAAIRRTRGESNAGTK